MSTYNALASYLRELEEEERLMKIIQIVGYVIAAGCVLIALAWWQHDPEKTLAAAKLTGLSGTSAYSLSLSLYTSIKADGAKRKRLALLRELERLNLGTIDANDFKGLLFDMLKDKLKDQ